MNRYVIIATRHTEEECADLSTEVGGLNRYFRDAGWTVKFMRNRKSIFEAYHSAIEEIDPHDDDKVILCHDDIEILLKIKTFNDLIDAWTKKEPNVGFVGVAGSPYLKPMANWVKSGRTTKDGENGGFIWHGKSMPTARFDYFGHAYQAIQLDGVFLATTGKVLKNIELRKPKSFVGGWHWYDAYYCLQAHLKGYNNYIMRLPIRHGSVGNYTDPTYFEDMRHFTELFEKYLPIVVRKLQE